MTPDFGAMAERQYFLEGAFRRLHVRLRTHAESIAFFGGGPREGRTVTASFDQLQVGVVFVRSRIDTRNLILCPRLFSGSGGTSLHNLLLTKLSEQFVFVTNMTTVVHPYLTFSFTGTTKGQATEIQ